MVNTSKEGIPPGAACLKRIDYSACILSILFLGCNETIGTASQRFGGESCRFKERKSKSSVGKRVFGRTAGEGKEAFQGPRLIKEGTLRADCMCAVVRCFPVVAAATVAVVIVIALLLLSLLLLHCCCCCRCFSRLSSYWVQM